MSDNYRFRVDGETLAEFEIAIKLAFRQYNNDIWHNGPATHFAITEKHGMVLFDYEFSSSQPPSIILELEDDKKSTGKYKEYPLQKFLFPMTSEDMISYGWRWIKNKNTLYPPEPDHDGSNHKGFSIGNEEWGHVLHDCHAFAYIKPDWQMYGK
jgi:hypothetical protein